ncbi:heme exporter protein CcmD [Pseudemcibacter aquimaris]|uniref:heme exporter protein CcmD n=1 Tax=Pseudemcibacter aquimaris TaxID=2857064 RepID=UPI002012AFAD|nr:heme exporter protein CcmD [Pseudemcibacter aquimaris]MCC3861952.1 heme exporter protein CcmD [Pseudemcibacter aquimaris]WDU58703.1 heme exporter protein CcmD [Pseudemcibacter aquimaris]
MGEYSIFVWPSYGAVVVLLLVLGVQSWISKRRDEKELDRLNRRFEELNKQD